MPEDYDELCADIRKLTNRLDTEAAVWAVICCAASVYDDIQGGSVEAIAATGSQSLYYRVLNKIRHKPSGPVPNPWFVFNGHEDHDSKKTANYKKSRTYKKGAGSISSAIGTGLSVHTAGINVMSSAMHANATGTTLIHMLQVKQIAKGIPNSKTIDEWCDVVLAAKLAKATIRGGQLAAGFIPGAHVPAAVAATIAKTGFKLTMTNSVYATAAAVHWRAFQEQRISGGLNLGTGGKVGPASRLFWEIFTKRGMTRVFGGYDAATLISEPGGWEALADKLLLI